MLLKFGRLVHYGFRRRQIQDGGRRRCGSRNLWHFGIFGGLLIAKFQGKSKIAASWLMLTMLVI